MGYTDHVLKHFEQPYHFGEIPSINIDHTSFGYSHVSSNCGDEAHLTIIVHPTEIIHCIWWQGTGCCFAMAATSMLVGHFEGLSLEDVYTFSKDDMLKLFKAPCPLVREECVLTSYHALKKLPRSLS